MSPVIVLLITALVLLILWFLMSKPKNFPPGPPRLPVVGGLPFVGNPPHKGLQNLKAKYGKLIGIYCGNHPAVIINDFQLIKDAFKDDRISARPPLRPFLERSWGHCTGLICSSGQEWAEQRKFTVTALRSLGFGTGRMEKAILDEVIEIVKTLKNEVNQPINLNRYFHVAIVNALWNIVAGRRFDYTDPELEELIQMTGPVIRFRSLDSDSFKPNIVFFMPWLTRLAPNFSGWNKLVDSSRHILPVFTKYIEEHRQDLNVESPKDFIDLYLQKMQDTKDESSSFYKDKGEKSLLIVLLDLFVAGGETTSSNMMWGFLFLAMYPEMQTKIHEEIDKVVGKNRLPSLSDRQKMPYLEAFIIEYLRLVTIGAFSVFHSTSEEIPDFHGYRLPKDCIVFGNFWEVHHDPEIWGDPENFRPERFLEGSKKDKLLAFSTGKRVCPGEALARDELFLFTVGILQHFTIEQDPASPLPCLDPMKAAVYRGHTSKVVIRQRT